MNPEGKLRITLTWDGQRIVRAALQPRALVRIETLLRGKRPEQALHIIPMLFSLCGKAQAAAAATALQAASEQRAPAIPLWRERLVLVEALQELLWRFLLDLPRIMGLPPDAELLARLRREFAASCIAGIDENTWQDNIARIEPAVCNALYSQASPAAGACTDADALMQTLRRAGTSTAAILLQCWQDHRWGGSAVALMPPADRTRMMDELLPTLKSTRDFPARPHWSGQPMETGALARNRRHPMLAALLQQENTSILARLLARLVEIDRLFNRLQERREGETGDEGWVQGTAGAQGNGLAWVQNARGLLIHHVALDEDGCIAAYRIVAPTEWNFHPEGAFVRGITGRIATDATQARQSAELLVQSLDPCVFHEIEVQDA